MCATIAVVPQWNHGVWARPISSSHIRSPDRAESTVGLGLVVTSQVSGLTQGQMHCLVEVLASLAVMLDHLVGDDPGQERPQLIAEGQVLLGELDMGEVHRDTVTLPGLICKDDLRRRNSNSSAPPVSSALADD